jgi:hypothetical protein
LLAPQGRKKGPFRLKIICNSRTGCGNGQSRAPLQQCRILALDIFLTTETNPAPDFIAHDKIALACRYLALMMRAKTPAGRLGSGLGQQRKPVRSIHIGSHARLLSLNSKKKYGTRLTPGHSLASGIGADVVDADARFH